MQIGSYLWNGFNGTLDYGFQKIDQGTAYLSKEAFETTRKISQLGPNRFSPWLYDITVWIEDNPKVINRAVNLFMLTADIAVGIAQVATSNMNGIYSIPEIYLNGVVISVSLDTFTHLVQLFVNNNTNPNWNKFLTFINCVRLYQIGTSQLLGGEKFTIVGNLTDSIVHLHNIRFNNVMMEKYNNNRLLA